MMAPDVIVIILIQNIICRLSTFLKTCIGFVVILYLFRIDIVFFTLSLHCDGRLYKANLAVGTVQQLR